MLMLNPKKLTDIFKIIIKESPEKGMDAVKKLKKYLDKNSWPIAMRKEDALKAIDMLLNEKLPEQELGQAMVDMMLMQTRKAPTISKKSAALLKEVKTIIENAKEIECDHTSLGIAPFMHGGGFTPNIGLPELICKKCGVNVTLHKGIVPKEYGIKILKKDLKTINQWAETCFSSQRSGHRVHSANEIIDDPILAYEHSIKWDAEIPIKITDPKLFQSMTGK